MTKNKRERFAEMKTFPNVIEPEFREIFNQDHWLKGKWQKEMFGNDHPLVLELGCGKGEYTVALARKNPQKNYIGIDIKGARMWRGAKTALEENLSNTLFLRTRIDFITAFFAEDEVSEIWITFPDPQPKKAKKRLVSTRFLSYYQQFLKHCGTIHLKTDNTSLFQYTLNVIDENDLALIHLEADIHGSEKPGLQAIRHIHTFYEKQFMEANKTIKYLAFELDTNQYLKEPPDG